MTAYSSSVRTYTLVFVALIVLLTLSVVVAQFHLGPWNTVIAMGISVGKAVLIVLFFMHVVHSSSLVRLLAVAGLLWFGFLITLTFCDYETRGWRSVSTPTYQASPLDRGDLAPPDR